MKKKTRLGTELVCVIFLFFSVIVSLLLAGSYLIYSRETDHLSRDRIARIGRTASSLIDGDWLKSLRDAVSSEEYQQLRGQAVSQEDPKLLEDYLEETGLYADYASCVRRLDSIRSSEQIDSLTVRALDGGEALSLADPDGSLLSLGAREKTEDGQAQGNEPVAAAIVHSESGWLCSCTEPVTASDGSVPGSVTAVWNMHEIISDRQRSAAILILLSAAGLILGAFAGIFYVRKRVSDPISRLSDEMSVFGSGDQDDLSAQVVELPARRPDEISDLYQSVRNMQLGIIRYTEHLKSVTEERQRLGTELGIANRIQSSMLPSTFPAFPNRDEFDVYALMKPAKSVAGDFYDFFLIDRDHLGVVMADVSGKGIPASLFMMMAKIIISNNAQLGIPPHEVLQMSNDRICENNEANMFVTVWFGIITISTGHVVASSAGHEYPVLQNENGVYELFYDKHGFVLGGMPGVRYKDYEFDLHKGQTLFLYTDGVPEATTAWNEQFGVERMVEALNKKQDADPQELVHYMLRTVDDFDGDVPQFDDITMLAIRYKGPSGVPE